MTGGQPPDALHELGALELADALAAGGTTSTAVVGALLARMEGLEPRLHALIATHPQALEQAGAADERRAAGRPRSALDGVPVLVKDNIEALGLPGSVGSLAMRDAPAQVDAPVVARLRAAGLVVLGAANLSEWANFRGLRSPSGWSAMGGLVDNPWQAGHSAGGSSSGSGAALAAGYAPLALGTETDGSITCPAALCGVVGLKPTVGLLPTRGIAPIAASQDAPGPMARSVADAAALLAVLLGQDPAVPVTAPGDRPGGPVLGAPAAWRTGDAATDACFDDACDRLRAAGIRVVEVDLPRAGAQLEDDELTVLVHEVADDLDAYLRRRPGLGPASLAALVAFNAAHAEVELAHFGQEYLERALASGGRAAPAYATARARTLAWAVGGTLAPAFGLGIDALVAPAYGPAWPSRLDGGDAFSGGALTTAPAIAGWPILTLPMGLVHGLPVGLGLVGPAHGEAALLRVGAAVEAVVGRLAPPELG
ncbi:MAG TPA: amidase family protein [Candidatus Nanopelagicales bacterium]